MANLPILEYPDPRLRIRAEPVTDIDAEIRQLLNFVIRKKSCTAWPTLHGIASSIYMMR
jgi:peptide deformylase